MKICGKVLRPLARCHHFLADFAVPGGIDLMELYAFAGQQFLGVLTIRAVANRIDVDHGHEAIER